jgi:hypothetical protein
LIAAQIVAVRILAVGAGARDAAITIDAGCAPARKNVADTATHRRAKECGTLA